ncbi:aminoacyl-histidine dipeptidase [Mediterraneibacter sp. ICN-202921]|uniref:aminoacyl-histidine dipeptidase n=1 Tax=Mediterraneibacter sp. ICN-202921 TaxID=3134657 RepID=UPI0030BA9F28
MDYKIKGYKPEQLFHFFEEISAIPRGSGNEKQISDYLVNFAQKRNLWVYQDSSHNVIIKKEGSKNAASLPPIMLQGHIDMVCEKNKNVQHDFTKDGLTLEVKDGILYADGTTLGADNGVAVALMLMVLDDEDITHPPLECVFTTEEEVGLLGAKALDKSLLSARTMINMDSEEEGIATVSCAGGVRIELTKTAERQTLDGTLLRLSIKGLLGGHSGSDIHKERHNANLLMARICCRLLEESAYHLVELNGGNKDNAIPRDCDATLLFTDSNTAVKAEELARRLFGQFQEEILPDEPAFSWEITMEKNSSAKVFTAEDSRAFLLAMYLAPNGVHKRNLKMDGFVVASSNLGVVRTEDDKQTIIFSPRSSVASLLEELKAHFKLLAETFGFTAAFIGEYPGWSYNETSAIRKVFQESYQELFGQTLRIEAIHAGLECGLFCDAIPGLDAIAVGPTILDCHTPQEHLPLDSFARFYQFLKDVLQRLANGNIPS